MGNELCNCMESREPEIIRNVAAPRLETKEAALQQFQCEDYEEAGAVLKDGASGADLQNTSNLSGMEQDEAKILEVIKFRKRSGQSFSRSDAKNWENLVRHSSIDRVREKGLELGNF